jgi:hypothetical protein
MVMRKHQRYFPVLASAQPGAALLPRFITVANGPVSAGGGAQGGACSLCWRQLQAVPVRHQEGKGRMRRYAPRLGAFHVFSLIRH